MNDADHEPKEAGDILARLLWKQGIDPLRGLAGPGPDCAHLRSGEICEAGNHYRAPTPEEQARRYRPAFVGRCPAIIAEKIREQVQAERERLAQTIARANRGGGWGFDGYDPTRHPAARAALHAIERVAEGRPPGHGALLAGQVGLGKTRLLLASHFVLLEAGINSQFVTSEELRGWFYRAVSFEDEAKREAKAALDPYRLAQAVHLDDLGDIDGDERKRGVFAAGLKAHLDKSKAVWDMSMNCNYDEAKAHPDIGDKLLSRLIDGIPVDCIVHMAGRDQRLPRRPVSR